MKNKIKIAIAAIPALALAIPKGVFAVTDIVPTQLSTQGATVGSLLTSLIRIVLIVAFVLSFIFLLIGGIRWITSGGDEKAVSGARNTITAALIGLVVVLLAFALIKLIEQFFGVTILSSGICIPTASNPGACN